MAQRVKIQCWGPVWSEKVGAAGGGGSVVGRDGYSMIIWNWNKVNSYISALKPLPRVPNRSKWPWCWDILIFETSGTSTSFGKCQWFYKCTIYIDEIWVESTTRYLWKHRFTPQHPPKHPKTIKITLRHPRHIPCSPGIALTTPKHSSNILLRGI